MPDGGELVWVVKIDQENRKIPEIYFRTYINVIPNLI